MLEGGDAQPLSPFMSHNAVWNDARATLENGAMNMRGGTNLRMEKEEEGDIHLGNLAIVVEISFIPTSGQDYASRTMQKYIVKIKSHSFLLNVVQQNSTKLC